MPKDDSKIIERPDLGTGMTNVVSVPTITVRQSREARRIKVDEDRDIYLLTKCMMVDGVSKDESFFLDEMEMDTYDKFIEAFCELVEFEKRKYLLMFTAKELADIYKEAEQKRKQDEENGIVPKKK